MGIGLTDLDSSNDLTLDAYLAQYRVNPLADELQWLDFADFYREDENFSKREKLADGQRVAVIDSPLAPTLVSFQDAEVYCNVTLQVNTDSNQLVVKTVNDKGGGPQYYNIPLNTLKDTKSGVAMFEVGNDEDDDKKVLVDRICFSKEGEVVILDRNPQPGQVAFTAMITMDNKLVIENTAGSSPHELAVMAKTGINTDNVPTGAESFPSVADRVDELRRSFQDDAKAGQIPLPTRRRGAAPASNRGPTPVEPATSAARGLDEIFEELRNEQDPVRTKAKADAKERYEESQRNARPNPTEGMSDYDTSEDNRYLEGRNMRVGKHLTQAEYESDREEQMEAQNRQLAYQAAEARMETGTENINWLLNQLRTKGQRDMTPSRNQLAYVARAIGVEQELTASGHEINPITDKELKKRINREQMQIVMDSFGISPRVAMSSKRGLIWRLIKELNAYNLNDAQRFKATNGEVAASHHAMRSTDDALYALIKSKLPSSPAGKWSYTVNGQNGPQAINYGGWAKGLKDDYEATNLRIRRALGMETTWKRIKRSMRRSRLGNLFLGRQETKTDKEERWMLARVGRLLHQRNMMQDRYEQAYWRQNPHLAS